MILALGVKPLKAATTVLIANTAPVAFGAVAIPITTAGEVGGKDATVIAALVGHQAPSSPSSSPSSSSGSSTA